MADQEIQVAEKKELASEGGEFTREGVYFTPAVDICETETELKVLVDMPGVNYENVDIELKENILTIEGKVPTEERRGQELLREYQTGNYFRSFRITEVVDQSKITASMSEGVLQLTLPKAEKAVPRKIPIATP
ncbi:MAG: Hsp20/alpha crystallin family protein [Desulfomonilaceae bacterium]|nr:Hsp20/alpha crystallin family protein [Desulfomonilaceae bacterium]